MSYDASLDPIWTEAPTAKNGVRFIPYEHLPEGHPIRLQLRPENRASVIIGDFRYVVLKNDNGVLVFQNPIKSSNNISTSINTRPSNAQTQPQTQGSDENAKLDEIARILRRIEMHILSKSKSDPTNTTNTDATNTTNTNDTTKAP